MSRLKAGAITAALFLIVLAWAVCLGKWPAQTLMTVSSLIIVWALATTYKGLREWKDR